MNAQRNLMLSAVFLGALMVGPGAATQQQAQEGGCQCSYSCGTAELECAEWCNMFHGTAQCYQICGQNANACFYACRSEFTSCP